MNIESLRDYCISKPGAEESFPFGPETMVYKVDGKIFLLTGLIMKISGVMLNAILKKQPNYGNSFPV